MATAGKKSEGYNYSAIEQNQNHIKNIFKRLTDRSYRVEQALGHNRDLYARNLYQAREQHAVRKNQLAEELERGQREGIQVGKRANQCAAAKKGCGLAGLDTGLPPDIKAAARAKSADPRQKQEGGRIFKPKIRSDQIEMIDIQNVKPSWAQLLKQTLHGEEEKDQKEQENKDFELIYQAQRDFRMRLASQKHEEKNPTIRKIFSKDPKQQAEVSHLEYMGIFGDQEHRERLLALLRHQFLFEVGNYGENDFVQLIKDCGDRRLVFKLINGEITFEQFVVRVDCESRGVQYVCRDDLIKDIGISEHFFEEGSVRKMEAFLKSLHGVTTLKDIKPETILHMGSPPAANQGRIPIEEATGEYLRKLENEQLQANQWRSNRKCLSSIFSVVPKEIEERQKLKSTYKQILFPKAPRFKSQLRSNARANVTKQEKKCGRHHDKDSTEKRSASVGHAHRRGSQVTNQNHQQDCDGPSQSVVESGKKEKTSLFFIRQMLHDGMSVSYNPDQALQMLYQGELATHLREQELKKYVVKKKLGPREIIPGAKKPKPQVKGESHSLSTFDRVEFRKNLDQRARSNIRMIQQSIQNQEEYQNNFGLAITNKQIERNPQELLKADTILMGRDYFKTISSPARKQRRFSAAYRGTSTSILQDYLYHSQAPIQNGEIGVRETELSQDGQPRAPAYNAPLSSTLQLSDLQQDQTPGSRVSATPGSPSKKFLIKQGINENKLNQIEMRESIPTLKPIELNQQDTIYNTKGNEYMQKTQDNIDLIADDFQQAFYKSKGGLSPADIALQANENCRNPDNDYAFKLNTESEPLLNPVTPNEMRSLQQSRFYVGQSPTRNPQIQTIQPEAGKDQRLVGKSFSESAYTGMSTAGYQKGTTFNNSPQRTIQTQFLDGQPQSLLRPKQQNSETSGLNSYKSSSSQFQKRRPSTGNIVGGGFKLKKTFTQNYKRAETPQRTRGGSNIIEGKNQKTGRSHRTGAIEGVLTRLAGINPTQLRDYQDQGPAVMTPGSPWDAETPQEGEDSSIVGDTGRVGLRTQSLEPKFDHQAQENRGLSPQRKLFIKYIESLGIKVNYEGLAEPGALTVSIKDEAGGGWNNGDQKPSVENDFGQYSNLIINSDNQIQIVAHSAGTNLAQNTVGDQIQDLQYQIIVLQPGPAEQQNQPQKSLGIDPILTGVKTFKSANDYGDSKKAVKFHKSKVQPVPQSQANPQSRKIKGLTQIQTNEDTLRDGSRQVDEYEESQAELKIAAAKYPNSRSSKMLEVRPISEHSKTFSQPLSPHTGTDGNNNIALETQTLNQSQERARKAQEELRSKRSTMSAGAKDGLDEASGELPQEGPLFTIEAQIQDNQTQSKVLLLKPGRGDLESQKENLHQFLNFLKSQQTQQNGGQIKSIMEPSVEAYKSMNFQSAADGRLLVGSMNTYSPFTQSIISGKKYNNPITVGDQVRLQSEMLKLDNMKLDTIMERVHDAGVNSLEVTPKSGIVTQITDSKLNSKLQGSKNQSRNQSPPIDSGQGTPVNQPKIDYHRNQVTSKIYREAYIGRSKKENIKSLALHKKHQLKDQEFAQQMLKQALIQAESVGNITLENKSAQNRRPNQSSADGRSSVMQNAHQIGEATLSNSSLAKMVGEQGIKTRPASSQPRVKQSIVFNKRRSPALIDLIQKERAPNTDLAEIDFTLSNEKHGQHQTKISTLGQNSRGSPSQLS